MNLHSVYTSCKWDNTSICPFVTLLLSCQQCFQEGALSFRYVLWLPKANCPYEPPASPPVSASQFAAECWLESKTPPLYSYLVFTGSGNSTWAIKLASKAFFYCQALPPAHVRACVKISPHISFTPSPFISLFKYYITIHICHVLFICSFAYWRLFVPLDYWEWCCCGHWFTKMVYTRTHAAIIRYKEWVDKFISIHLRQVNYYVKKYQNDSFKRKK